MYQRAKYLGQSSFISKVIVQTNEKHTDTSDFLLEPLQQQTNRLQILALICQLAS